MRASASGGRLRLQRAIAAAAGRREGAALALTLALTLTLTLTLTLFFRYEGMPPPWTLVSPEGTLHLVADAKALVAFSHQHKLVTQSLRAMLGFSKKRPLPLKHKGWHVRL